MHCHADAGVESAATMISPTVAVVKANFIFCPSVSG
jgi:hypothetical protein